MAPEKQKTTSQRWFREKAEDPPTLVEIVDPVD